MSSRWLALPFFCAICIAYAQEPPKPERQSLSLDDIIKLFNERISDDIIISRIKGNAKAFDLNAGEILELHKLGVSDTVVKYMLNPNYSPPPPVSPPSLLPGVSLNPPVSDAPPRPPSDPLALKVPPESGIYYLTDMMDFMALNLRTVVPSKQPGKMPLFKGHVIGSMVGAGAATRLTSGSATFYVRLAEKASIDDLQLLLLDKNGTHRDLDFGSKPGKPVFRVNSFNSFESKNVSPGLFRVVAPLSRTGEYLFYILGSADEKKGLLGRGYDFGVD
jgi:hypothetical protein